MKTPIYLKWAAVYFVCLSMFASCGNVGEETINVSSVKLNSSSLNLV